MPDGMVSLLLSGMDTSEEGTRLFVFERNNESTLNNKKNFQLTLALTLSTLSTLTTYIIPLL